MKIRQVTIENMHTMDKETFSFDDFSYLYGSNGSGKSTVLQAIQFCFLGYIPDTSKLGTAILKHSNSNNLTVSIVLEDSTTSNQLITITRKLYKSGTKVCNEVEIIPKIDLETLVGDLELPIFNWAEFISLTANKQKSLLTHILPSSKISMNTAEVLKTDNSYKDSCKSIVQDVCSQFPELDSIETIQNVNSYLKEQLSVANSEVTRLTNTVQSLIYYEDYVGEKDVDVLQNQVNILLKKMNNTVKLELQLQTYQEKLEQLNSYRDTLKSSINDDERYSYLCDQIELLENQQIPSIDSEIFELSLARESTLSSINQNNRIIESQGVCPYTKEACPSIQKLINQLKEENEEYILSANSMLSDIESKKDIKRTKVNLLEQYKQEKIQIEHSYNEQDILRKELAEIEVTEITESSSDLRERIKILNDDIAKASANQKYEELTSNILAQKLQLEDQITFLKSVVKRTGENGLQTTVLIQPFNDLADMMHTYMKAFNLEHIGSPQFVLEQKANSFTFGFMRDKFIPFNMLSSGEKCIFIMLFMLAITQLSTTQLNFVLIDDLLDHLDHKRFETVIKNVKQFSDKTQFIIAGVQPVDNSQVSVINLNEL